MFRRANKITSLLVTAAAVMSLVPAYAADVKKVDSQDGKVYNAVAYKDGEFYIDGEVNNKDEAAYYLANGKYNSLSDIDSGSDIATYGTKYVEVQDGDYYIDLSTGKVTDNSIADDARDDAASSLRKKVKADTDGRYTKDGLVGAADYLQTFTSSNEILGSKFGQVWYATTLKAKNTTNGAQSTLNVFTDGAGNYIDADYNLGKIKVTTTASGVSDKSVYIDNTEDTYDAAKTGTVSAAITQTQILGQDKDYIYRTAQVTVTTTSSAATISAIDGKPLTVTGKTTPFTVSGNNVSFNVIQKISKAQSSSDIGGAKYSKTVSTYIIADSDGYNEAFSYSNYTVANGKIVGYNKNSDSVDVRTATLKSKDGLYYVDLASASTGDDVKVYDSNKLAIDVDSDGNLWRLNGGYIYQWDNDEDWNKVYKVDGSFDQLQVYDKDNIVAWNQDDEVYSVIGGKKIDDTKTDPVTPVVTIGWVQATDGTWSYNKTDGTKATGWIQDGANWYYTNTAGVMQYGWQNMGGTWYYLNPISDGTKGAMKTGWQSIGGTWYYLNPISDGTKGAMKTGWINDNGTWYYLNSSGAMLANTTVDGYRLGSNGAWIR